MAQQEAWEREYRNPKLLTKENTPRADVLRFVRWLKKEQEVELEGKNVLDLGSGTGRNAEYFAELSAQVAGIEISKTAIGEAVESAEAKKLSIKYIAQSMGDKFPFSDNSFDIALDIMSSNSLSEKERQSYLEELGRTLKPGAYMLVRTLCKEGDHNAKYLLKNSPGKEYDTYYMKELNLTERVWSKEDFQKTYSPYFNILFIEKTTHYAQMNNRSYKRNYWAAYLQKK